MQTRFNTKDLNSAGLSDREIQAVLTAGDSQQQLRLLRASRGRLLEEVHNAQERLDLLDYFICQLRKEELFEGNQGAAVRAKSEMTKGRKAS